jgi:cell division protein FtsW (lipid II flippase)
MPRLNKTLLACVALLGGMGLLSLWTQAPPTDLSGESITKSIFLRQATFLAGALGLTGIVALPHYQLYRRLAWVGYGVCVVALAVLLFKGDATRGTRGWFKIGPFMLQPAEFMKIALVLALARVLMYGREVQRWLGVLLPAAVVALPAALVVVQPDLGTTILFVPTLLAMLYAAGARKRHLAAMLLVLVVTAPLVYKFGMKDYQRHRLLSFALKDKVAPELRYQQEQSVKACASGGLAGRGIGEGGAALPFYVPDRHTDFVYSIIAEELGFLGSSFVLLLFGVYYAQSLRIARHSREPFGRLVVVGLTALLGTQTFINLGMTLGVAPITGVTLPFISYGGSSLLMCGISAGLVLNVAARWQPGFSSRDMSGGTVEIREFQPQKVKWLSF